jgi:hypothetical protein
MNCFRDGQNLEGDHLRAARKRYVAMAAERLKRVSERLGVTELEITEALKRGWLWEQIEAVGSRYHLESLPPALPDVPAFVDFRIAEAAVKGNTALSAAFRKARAA